MKTKNNQTMKYLELILPDGTFYLIPASGIQCVCFHAKDDDNKADITLLRIAGKEKTIDVDGDRAKPLYDHLKELLSAEPLKV